MLYVDRTSSSFTVENASVASDVLLELYPDAGGGKGWPTNTSVVIYHRDKGMILAGTDSGSICAYGDGVQYMKAPTDYEDPQAVSMLVPMSNDMVLAVYDDNSMELLTLPELTRTGASLPSTWLLRGAISCVRTDE